MDIAFDLEDIKLNSLEQDTDRTIQNTVNRSSMVKPVAIWRDWLLVLVIVFVER